MPTTPLLSNTMALTIPGAGIFRQDPAALVVAGAVQDVLKPKGVSFEGKIITEDLKIKSFRQKRNATVWRSRSDGKRCPGRGGALFDSVESVLSHLLFSIPGVKGVEFGAGFALADMREQPHDEFQIEKGKVLPKRITAAG